MYNDLESEFFEELSESEIKSSLREKSDDIIVNNQQEEGEELSSSWGRYPERYNENINAEIIYPHIQKLLSKNNEKSLEKKGHSSRDY